MAFRYEQDDKGLSWGVLDGFEQGISDSPELGIADMRNISNDAIPGIAMCNFALVQKNQTPFNVAPVFNSGSNNVTWTGTDLIHPAPVAVYFTGASLPAAITANTPYWLVRTSANTATIWTKYNTDTGANTQVALAGNGSGTMHMITINPAQFKDHTVDAYGGLVYMIDSIGQIWVLMYNTSPPSALSGANDIVNYPYVPVFLAVSGTGPKVNAVYNPANPGTANTQVNGNGIVWYGNFLFVFTNHNIDAFGNRGNGTWSMNWKTLNTGATSNFPHHAKWGQDNIAYYCDANFIGNISGAGAADPLSIGSYASNTQALTLPLSEVTQWLEEPSIDTTNGNMIYISTSTSSYIYPWDKYTTNFFAPIVMPEIGGYKMLNINKIVYILAGKRGNIYWTDGSRAILFKSMPKYPTQSPFSLFGWGGIMSLNNNLVFGVQDQNTSGTATNNASGSWSITLSEGQLLNSVAGSLRYKNQPSVGVYNADVLIPLNDGLQFLCCSYNGTSGYVDMLDSTTPTFYSSYQSYLETDIVPVGTAINPKNLNIIEAKVDMPLVSGDKFKILMRSNLNASYTQVFEQTTVGAVSGNSASVPGVPLKNLQWVQFKAQLQTSSGGSYTRLREIRFR